MFFFFNFPLATTSPSNPRASKVERRTRERSPARVRRTSCSRPGSWQRRPRCRRPRWEAPWSSRTTVQRRPSIARAWRHVPRRSVEAETCRWKKPRDLKFFSFSHNDFTTLFVFYNKFDRYFNLPKRPSLMSSIVKILMNGKLIDDFTWIDVTCLPYVDAFGLSSWNRQVKIKM